jgi:2-dehydropantoate 2-reductase
MSSTLSKATRLTTENSTAELHWVVAGAGSVGLWLGAHLVAAGHKVTFLARSRIISEVRAHGVHLTSWKGEDLTVPSDQMVLTESDECLAHADVVIVSVKSKDTFFLAEQISRKISSTTRVISAQNGIHNIETLSNILPDHQVVSLMVPYNVLSMGQGRYHCGTDGQLVLDRRFEDLTDVFLKSGLSIQVERHMQSVLWGKLLLNLNNPLNALSGMTLVSELSERKWRVMLAELIEEGIEVAEELGIHPVLPSPIPARWIPKVLRLPTFLFRIVAAKMLSIDPLARSSMQDDVKRGRATEIDYINGEISRYGRSLGIDTPLNDAIVRRIQQLEQDIQFFTPN